MSHYLESQDTIEKRRHLYDDIDMDAVIEHEESLARMAEARAKGCKMEFEGMDVRCAHAREGNES